MLILRFYFARAAVKRKDGGFKAVRTKAALQNLWNSRTYRPADAALTVAAAWGSAPESTVSPNSEIV